ncbi:MAG: glycosyltransferase, partial [Bacteroidia bacterium]|nr:glycosyltransferase [Bacteroidia bacterium]
VVSQPLFFIGLTVAIFGLLFVLAGFLGELIARGAPDRKRYNVAEKCGFEGTD